MGVFDLSGTFSTFIRPTITTLLLVPVGDSEIMLQCISKFSSPTKVLQRDYANQLPALEKRQIGRQTRAK